MGEKKVWILISIALFFKRAYADPQINVCNWKLLSYFPTKTYVVDTQKNSLNETPKTPVLTDG